MVDDIRWYKGTISWIDMAHWLREELPTMRFTVNQEHKTICTVWFESDPQGAKVHHMDKIITNLFGGYSCTPMSNYEWENHPTHTSFGFWNQALIDNARRVLTLPDDLRPGRPLYYETLSVDSWAKMERAYNKQPKDLPQQ